MQRGIFRAQKGHLAVVRQGRKIDGRRHCGRGVFFGRLYGDQLRAE